MLYDLATAYALSNYLAIQKYKTRLRAINISAMVPSFRLTPADPEARCRRVGYCSPNGR